MAKKDADVRSVRVTVAIPWDRAAGCTLTKEMVSGKPDVGKYDSWRAAADRAVTVADQQGLEDVVLELVHEGTAYEVRAVVKYDQSGNPRPFAVDPMVEAEKYLNRRGYETQSIGSGMYTVEKPDAVGGTHRKKGYLSTGQFLGLSGMADHDIDAVLNSSWRGEMKKSTMARYLLTPTVRGGSMAKKTEEKAAKPTAKGTGGKDVELSPKMAEVLEAIQKGEKAGKPLGSGSDRLDDPTSIAAMKLARDGVAHRVKSGTRFRFHYYASKGAADKAQAQAEKDAAAAAKKPAKAPSKSAAKSNGKPNEESAGKKKSGPLKKPSEK